MIVATLIVYIILAIFSFICWLVTKSSNVISFNRLQRGGDDTADILSLVEKITRQFIDKDHRPIYTYDDIPDRYPYQGGFKNLKFNCHLGQRKLLLNEVQFYSCYLVGSAQPLIIYAGSASGEHTPIILKMFPNAKLLLVDPNYHNINTELMYVYQNPEIISKDNIREFKRYISDSESSSKSTRLSHLSQGANRLLNMQFMTYAESLNTIQSAEDFYSKNDSDLLKTIDSIKSDFILKDHKKLVDNIMKSENRVFIIQDYMTIELSKLLSKSIDAFGNLDTFFVTDIRTNMFGRHPMDMDILWNSALQISYLKILKPKYSMLKFHPPYFEEDSKKQISDFMANPEADTPTLAMIRSDLEFVKKEYKIDLLSDYKSRMFQYFKNDTIFQQPWGPVSTSEARLIVSAANIDKYQKYDVQEWEDKFFYMRYYRSYAYHGLFYNLIKSHPQNHYDGCLSCCMEIMILCYYIMQKESDKFTVSGDIPIDAIAKRLLDPEFVDTLMNWYQTTNDVTFYNLAYNNKCPGHGGLKNPPSDINVYLTSRVGHNKLNIEKFTITKKTMESAGIMTATITKDHTVEYENKHDIQLSSNNPISPKYADRAMDDFVFTTIKF